jgi:hypothetical protein
VDAIGIYIRDRIEFADQVIADSAKEKIKPGSTIVTYARSVLINRTRGTLLTHQVVNRRESHIGGLERYARRQPRGVV